MTTQTFDTWWKKLKPSECDELKQYFVECWNEAQAAVVPVAWIDTFGNLFSERAVNDEMKRGLTPLYTTPPVQVAVEPATRSVRILQKDANSYCQIVSILGMEEEGDPVEEVRKLKAQAAVEPVVTIEIVDPDGRGSKDWGFVGSTESLYSLPCGTYKFYTTPPDHTAAMRAALAALETAKNGLDWYRDMYPESVNGSDDEADSELGAAITQLRAALGEQG